MKRTILLLVWLVVPVSETLPRTALATDPQIIHTELLPPLLRAAEAGRTEEVRRLLRRGAKVNEKFPELGGLTPLMLAAMRGHLDTVEVLLKAGADPNASGGVAHVGHWTPLLMAVRSKTKNNLEVIDALIAGGARLNPPPSENESPLDAAIVGNDIPLIRALLKRGSDVNWQDEFGNTPLVTAVTHGNRIAEVVSILLEAGADPNKTVIWDGEGCVSILKHLDENLRMSREMRLPQDKVMEEIRRLIIQAGGRSFTKKSRGELCKPSSLIN